MRARVIVAPRSGVLDPQGKAIEGALATLRGEAIETPLTKHDASPL